MKRIVASNVFCAVLFFVVLVCMITVQKWKKANANPRQHMVQTAVE